MWRVVREARDKGYVETLSSVVDPDINLPRNFTVRGFVERPLSTHPSKDRQPTS